MNSLSQQQCTLPVLHAGSNLYGIAFSDDLNGLPFFLIAANDSGNKRETLVGTMPIYRFSSNVPFFVDYPLSGTTDIGILHSLNNQQKKAVLYEKQYSLWRSVLRCIIYTGLHMNPYDATLHRHG
ncbi:MAG: hypothetical protein LBU32_09975 [Clostridiales bacterium]|nr:hypothetical protein [Clostridiales bacterium]